jgi:Zn-dependent M28 family amino/carboxypeptidase
MGDLWPIVVLTNEKLTWGMGTKELRYPVFWINKPGISKIKTISYQVDQKLVNQKTNNLMAMVKGTAKKSNYLLVTAHYDHLGRMGSETVFPGANDNASGVAEMMALAAYFVKNPLQKNILFIAFSGEEAGLVGSKYFVNNPPVSLDSIDFVLNLDLSGTGDEGITVVNATLYPEIFDKLVKLNEEGNYVGKVKKRGPAANSDHYFFTEKNIPAFFIYTLGGIKAYHDIYDLPETLPLTEIADLKQLYIRFFKYLDGVEKSE